MENFYLSFGSGLQSLNSLRSFIEANEFETTSAFDELTSKNSSSEVEEFDFDF